MCLYIAGMLSERAEGETSAVLPRSSIPELTAPLGSSELWAHFQAAVQASIGASLVLILGLFTGPRLHPGQHLGGMAT